MVGNMVGGVGEGRGDMIGDGVEMDEAFDLFDFEFGEQDGSASGGFSSLNIHEAVADHPTFAQRKAALACGFEKHARLGFAAVAGADEFGSVAFGGMVRTAFKGIPGGVFFAQKFGEPVVDGVEFFFGEGSLGDAGLIGDHDDFKMQFAQSVNEFGGAGDEAHLFGAAR